MPPKLKLPPPAGAAVEVTDVPNPANVGLVAAAAGAPKLNPVAPVVEAETELPNDWPVPVAVVLAVPKLNPVFKVVAAVDVPKLAAPKVGGAVDTVEAEAIPPNPGAGTDRNILNQTQSDHQLY